MRILFVLIIAFLALFSGANANKIKCEMCDYIIHATTDLLNQNFTRSEIITNLESACSFLPHKWTPTCQTVVDVYGIQIINKILAKETAPVICGQIHLCPKSAHEESEQHHGGKHNNKNKHNNKHNNNKHHGGKHNNKNEEQVKLAAEQEQEQPMLGFHWKKHHHNPLKKFECKACNYAVKHAESHILNGETQSDVERAVDKECDNFEIHEAIHICKKVIHDSINTIFTQIKKHETVDHVCKQIHMC